MVLILMAAFSIVFGAIFGYATAFFFSATSLVGQTIAGIIGGGGMSGLAVSITGDPNKLSGSGLARFLIGFIFGALGGMGSASQLEIYRELFWLLRIAPPF